MNKKELLKTVETFVSRMGSGINEKEINKRIVSGFSVKSLTNSIFQTNGEYFVKTSVVFELRQGV